MSNDSFLDAVVADILGIDDDIKNQIKAKTEFASNDIRFSPTQTNLIHDKTAEQFFACFCGEYLIELVDVCKNAVHRESIRQNVPTLFELDRRGFKHLTIACQGTWIGYVLYQDKFMLYPNRRIHIDTIFVSKLFRSDALMKEVHRKTMDLFTEAYPKIRAVTLEVIGEHSEQMALAVEQGYSPERIWFTYSNPKFEASQTTEKPAEPTTEMEAGE